MGLRRLLLRYFPPGAERRERAGRGLPVLAAAVPGLGLRGGLGGVGSAGGAERTSWRVPHPSGPGTAGRLQAHPQPAGAEVPLLVRCLRERLRLRLASHCKV